MDYVDRFASAEMRFLMKQILRTYKQAAREVQEKLDEFNRAHERKNQHKLQQLADGVITEAQYKSWLQGQVFQTNLWKQKLKDITNTYVHADDVARALVGKTNFSVFCEAANYTAYDICKHFGMGVSFDLYDKATVDRLLRKNPKMLPEWKINEEKDYVWNEKRVQNAVTQGIVQGESIPQISERLSGELATSNARKMELFARTAITGAENAGRVTRMEEAQEMGITVQKKWIATLDHRTRDAHQHLDGQIQDVDKPFESILGDIMFPGDPDAEPANVYNCRCTLGYHYPEYSQAGQRRAYNDPDSRESEVIDYVTYDQWKIDRQSASLLQTEKKKGTISMPDGVRSPIEQRNTGKGNPAAITHFDRPLNKRQQELLDSLPDFGSRIVVRKGDVNMTDLASMTAVTGHEFAMFTRKGERLVIRGNEIQTPVNKEQAKELAEQGYRWSGHTHPGTGVNTLVASNGDITVLEAFGQQTSVIYNSLGEYLQFGR